MATNVNILPSLYVDRINLESKHAAVGGRLSDNPHINEIHKATKVMASLAGVSEASLLGNNEIRMPIRNTISNKGNTLVSVTVMVKDVQEGKDNIPLWIDDEFIKKFIAINVVAVDNKELEDKVLQKHIGKLIRGEQFNELITKKVRHFIVYLNEKKTTTQTNGTGWRSPASAYSTYDHKLRKHVFKIPYEFEFEIPKDQNNLTLIVFPSIDLGGKGNTLQEELNVNPSKFDLVYGAPMVEKVLINGAPSAVTDEFRTLDDVSWYGPIHWVKPKKAADGSEFPGKYMTGNNASAASVELMRKKIQNFKISDYRRIERITTPRVLDFSSIENLASQLNNKVKMASQKPLYAGKNISYVSELYMTPAESIRHGMINNMFFVLDWRKLVKDNCMFPSLLDVPDKPEDSGRVDQILSNSQILSFKVFRQKISNSITYTSPPMAEIDENIPLELIASSEQRGQGLVTNVRKKTISRGKPEIKHTSGQDGKSILAMGGIKEITGLNVSRGIGKRFFTITDSLEGVSAGRYQYFIELRVKSGVQRYVRKKLKNIRVSLRKLKKYHQRAMKGADSKGAGSWNNIHKRFTSQFISKENKNTSIWNEPIELYLDCAAMLYQDSGELFSTGKIKSNFRNMCKPSTGSPKGISIVINLIEDFVTRIGKILGSNPNLNKDGLGQKTETYTDLSISHKPTSAKRTFDYKYEFPEILDLNFLTMNTGYEFLGSRMPNTVNHEQNWTQAVGIKTLSNQSYATRTFLEMNKYLKSELTDDRNAEDLSLYITAMADGNPSKLEWYSGKILAAYQAYRYLTPSAIKTTNTTIDLLEGKFEPFYHITKQDTVRTNKLAVLTLQEQIMAGSYSTKILANSKNKKPLIKPGAGLDSMLGIMEKYNCRVISKQETDRKYYNLSTKPVSREKVMGTAPPNDLFILNDEGVPELNPTSGHHGNIGAHVNSLLANIRSSSGAKYDFGAKVEGEQEQMLELYAGVAAFNSAAQFSFGSDLYNLDDTSNPMRNELMGRKDYVNSLPLPLLLLFVENSKSNKAWADMLKRRATDAKQDAYDVWMDYKNIVAVEYLHGFSGDSQYISVGENTKKLITSHASSPQWLPLTPEAIDTMKGKGAFNMICRLTRYYNKDFKIRESTLTSKIPILNKYFVMSIGEVSAIDLGSMNQGMIPGGMTLPGIGTTPGIY